MTTFSSSPTPPARFGVPIAKAEWFWKATAVKGRTDWKLTVRGGKVTKKGAVTTEFPSYESNVSENDWMEIP